MRLRDWSETGCANIPVRFVIPGPGPASRRPSRQAMSPEVVRIWHNRPAMHDSDLAIVDLETTGTSPLGARITEFAMLRVHGGELAEEWSTLVNPGSSIPPAIQWLTGITDGMVAAAIQHGGEIVDM